MTPVKYITSVLKNFINNIHYLGEFDLRSSVKVYKDNQKLLQKISILSFFQANPNLAKHYDIELNHLTENHLWDAFPYTSQKHISFDIIAAIDDNNKLPYVIHHNKKLFFPSSWSVEECKECYINFIERENILGGCYTVKAPHQYQDNQIKIEKNDILLDIGCAEGLLALDAVELAKKIYLFEGDYKWIEPLKATFAPYKEKVQIIPKYVTDKNDHSNIQLSSLFNEIVGESFFVKMDIEGAEQIVLKNSKGFFCSPNKIKLSCCTYHKKNDAEEIASILSNWNYKYHFSEGYMLYYCDENFTPPYFRRGLIRAQKESNRE